MIKRLHVRRLIGFIVALCMFLDGTLNAFQVPTTLHLCNTITATPASNIVLHIQDIHQNFEAQQSISIALRQLIKQNQVDLVALEGGFGPIDMSAFRRFSDPAVVTQSAHCFLKNGLISGALDALLQRADVPTVGIDDETHHQRNVEAYRKAQVDELRLRRRYLHAQTRWWNLSKTRMNHQLRAWVSELDRFQRGRSSYQNHLMTLCNIIGWQTFSQAQMARTYLLLTQLESALATANPAGINSSALFAYRRYLNLCRGIDAKKLNQETRILEQIATNRLTKNKIEQEAVIQAHCFYLISKLLRFSLTKNEWKEYKKLVLGRTVDVENFENFYREAEIRDQKMASNFLEAIKTVQPKGSTVNSQYHVLITGGFHTEGIDQRLQKAGYTVVQVTPELTRMGRNPESYLTRLLQQTAPFDELFSGTKQFLSPLQTQFLSTLQLAIASQAPDPNTELRRASPQTPLVAVEHESDSGSKTIVWRNLKTGFSRTLLLIFRSGHLERVENEKPSLLTSVRLHSVFYNLLIFLGCQPTPTLKILGIFMVPAESLLIFGGMYALSFSVVSQLCFLVAGALIDFTLSYYGHKWRGVPLPIRPIQFLSTATLVVIYALTYYANPGTPQQLIETFPFWQAVFAHVIVDAGTFFWESLIQAGLIHPGLRYDSELYEFFIGGYLSDRENVLIKPDIQFEDGKAYGAELVLQNLLTSYIPTVAKELDVDANLVLDELNNRFEIRGVKIPTKLLIAQLFSTRYRWGMIRASRGDQPIIYVPLEAFEHLSSEDEKRHMAFALIFGVLWRRQYESVHNEVESGDLKERVRIVHNKMAQFEKKWNALEKPYLTYRFQWRHLKRYVQDKLRMLLIDIELHREFQTLQNDNAGTERKIRSYMNDFRKQQSSVIARSQISSRFRDMRIEVMQIVNKYEALLNKAVAMGEYNVTLPIIRWIRYLLVVDDALLPLQRTCMLLNVLLRQGRHERELIQLLRNIRDREIEYPIFYGSFLSWQSLIRTLTFWHHKGFTATVDRIRQQLGRKVTKIYPHEVQNFSIVAKNTNLIKSLTATFIRHAEIVHDDRNRDDIIDTLNECLQLMKDIEEQLALDLQTMDQDPTRVNIQDAANRVPWFWSLLVGPTPPQNTPHKNLSMSSNLLENPIVIYSRTPLSRRWSTWLGRFREFSKQA